MSSTSNDGSDSVSDYAEVRGPSLRKRPRRKMMSSTSKDSSDSESDYAEFQPGSSKVPKRITARKEYIQGAGGASEEFVEDQIIIAPEMGSTSDDSSDSESSDYAGFEPGSCKMPPKRITTRKEYIQGTGGASEEFQDQIIVVPEIMSRILSQLDLRSLKNCRLVCKSWLKEVQAHLIRRAVVRFERLGYSERIKAFKEIRQKNLLRGLPQPFQNLDIDLGFINERLPYKMLLKQLHLLTRPPLMLTRFSPADVPLKLALPLIIQCSSTLEYLRLEAGACEPGYLPEMDSKQTFPRLRHVNTVMASCRAGQKNLVSQITYFPSIVVWIANASPSLETWESRGTANVELASELLMKVNIKNVKTLLLSDYKLNRIASELFLSIHFCRLQHLRFKNIHSEASLNNWSSLAVAEVVKLSAATLKKLDLSVINPPANSVFPVCPNVEELTLSVWNSRNCIISNTFPALRVLSARRINVKSLRDQPPLLGVKTLRVDCYGNSVKRSFQLLGKFPDMERVRLDAATLLGCCGLIVQRDPGFQNIFEGVKHLEVAEDCHSQHDPSLFRVFGGIDTITVVSSSEDIEWIPLEHIPSLKTIQFQWGNGVHLDKLLETARRVEKVVVTNCCSVGRLRDPEFKNILNNFFESAPNAECGCSKDRKEVGTRRFRFSTSDD